MVFQRYNGCVAPQIRSLPRRAETFCPKNSTVLIVPYRINGRRHRGDDRITQCVSVYLAPGTWYTVSRPIVASKHHKADDRITQCDKCLSGIG